MSRTYPERPIVAVGAAVCRGERVLVVQRGREPSLGRWTLPGGAVDLGERMRDAAAREVREECGIEIEVGEVVTVLDNIVRDEHGAVRYHYAIVDFAARYVSGELVPNEELTGAAWITPAQFDAYDVASKAQAALHRALHLVAGKPGATSLSAR
ncbi:MAG: NUDIX hydrolase [Anaerolineae bacterium]